jgi:hypothetical protein
LQSIEAAPEPVGGTLPEGVCRDDLAYQAEEAFVKLLSMDYIAMVKRPRMLTMRGRGGGGATFWIGWAKFSPVDLMDVFEMIVLGADIDTYFRSQDKLLMFT